MYVPTAKMASAFTSPSTSLSQQRDSVFLRNLALNATIGKDAWHRDDKPQPVILSLRISFDVAAAAAADDVAKTLDYGKLCKAIISNIETSAPFDSVTDFGDTVMDDSLLTLEDLSYQTMELEILMPKALLRVDGGLRLRMKTHWTSPDRDVWTKSTNVRVEGIQASCIVGVNAHERIEKQLVVLNLEVEGDQAVESFLNVYRPAVRVVIERVEGSKFQTVEALATFVARILTMEFDVDTITVSVEKPSALALAEGAGVEITRRRKFFSTSRFWNRDSEGRFEI